MSSALPDYEEITSQLKLIETNRRALALLVQQQARFGSIFVPIYILLDIEQRRTNIRGVKATLRGWDVTVEELPEDEEVLSSSASASHQAGAMLNVVADLASVPADCCSL